MGWSSARVSRTSTAVDMVRALAVFHGLGKIQFVEENVAQLFGRADVEFESGELVDFFRFDGDLAFEFGRHFR